MRGEADSTYYQYFDLGPAFELAVLYDGPTMTSFDIYHFSSVFTYNHGNPINVGQTDKRYTVTRLSEDFLMPAFIMQLIRKKIANLPPEIRSFVVRGLDEYQEQHLREYAEI